MSKPLELTIYPPLGEEPPHAGLASFMPGDTVTVISPRPGWHGTSGRVRQTSPTQTQVDFPGMHTQWISNEHLTKGEQEC